MPCVYQRVILPALLEILLQVSKVSNSIVVNCPELLRPMEIVQEQIWLCCRLEENIGSYPQTSIAQIDLERNQENVCIAPIQTPIYSNPS